MKVADFVDLTPDFILDSVEEELGCRLAGFTHPLSSYINRVYELQCMDGKRVVAKFYRPGRWIKEALLDEHAFVTECAKEDIPTIVPMELTSGTTLGEANGVYFAVYPKGLGRPWEAIDEESWLRLGRIISRMHVVGSRVDADNRLVMLPEKSTAADIKQLVEGNFISKRFQKQFKDLTSEIMDLIVPLFEDVEPIRIHGDCHAGNILERPDEGLMLIDFDDMVMGPAVQDLWMLLPNYAENSRLELDLIIEGYEMFRDFDYSWLKLIEPLRVMRFLYFQAWVSKQQDDCNFAKQYPHWGTDSFWQVELAELGKQVSVIKDHLNCGFSGNPGNSW